MDRIDRIKVSVVHSDDERLPEVGPQGRVDPYEFVDGNVSKMLAFLNEAGRNHADLACTHECFTGSGLFASDLDHPELFISLVEEIPGPTSQKLGEVAKQYGMYIAANTYEKSGDTIFNTSVLIDRSGEIVGKYRKMHLADGERWYTTPGDEVPVFETELGTIAFATCYDIIFPEFCRIAALKGADILIHQTQGWGIGRRSGAIGGESMLRTRAAENSVYLLVSKNIQQGDGGKSCVIDNYGNLLAESPIEAECIVYAEFKPDPDMIDKYHFDNFYAGVPGTRARQLLARRPALYRDLVSENPPLLDRFPGMKLLTSDAVQEKLRLWAGLSDEEKEKYHW
jgi:N-carbamoylputrescine amidase